jgi:hypothetical protein
MQFSVRTSLKDRDLTLGMPEVEERSNCRDRQPKKGGIQRCRPMEAVGQSVNYG